MQAKDWPEIGIREAILHRGLYKQSKVRVIRKTLLSWLKRETQSTTVMSLEFLKA